VKNTQRLAIALAIALGTVIALAIALGTVAAPALAYPEVEPVGIAPADVITITILHTNDFHGHVDEWESWGNVYGGSARIATKIKEIRDAQDNVLVLDAGDQFQGTLFYTLFKADIVTVTMNALDYDAMAVGNHEFDDGPGELARLIDGVDFPVLSANIDASAEPGLAGKIEASTVITLSGEPIGIVGLTTPDTENISSPGQNVTFNDPVTSTQAAIDALTARGINKIIALTHLGYNEDVALAQAVTGVDVIVGGHSHTFLYTPPDDAAGPYPTVVNDLGGNPVLVVTAECWGKYLGYLDVTFDTAGVVSSYDGNPILMDDTIAKDADVEAIVATYRPQVDDLMNTIVGTSTVEMPLSVSSQRICRMGECLLGNLVADAMLWKINSVAPEPYQMAIQNGGGLRAPIDAGPISVGEIMELLPFGNAIATFEITGTYIIEALENGVSAFGGTSGTGRFPQVSGMRYTWNPNMPVGSRIVAVEVLSGTSYVPLNETVIYRVVTNDFMRGGGDGYTVFSDFAIDPYDFGPALDEALMDYVTEFSPVSPTIEGRVIGPDIVVTPLTLSAELDQGDTTTDTLTISNMGTVTRTWNMTKATTADWLTLAQTSGTLVPDEVVITGTATMIMPDSVDVVVTFDATGLEADVYTTTLVVTSDAPDESPVNVLVTLTVNEFKIFLPLVLRNYGS
jgi:5'-nucleotidase